MASTTILSDNGATSGSAGLKTQGGNDGTLLLQTTTSGGTATTAVTINTSQNIGIGVSPSTWSQGKAAEIGAVGNGVWAYSGVTRLMENVYFNSGYKYAATGVAAAYMSIDGGTFNWNTTGTTTGTLGTTATFTQAMTLDASGNLLVGGPSGSYRLTVTGATSDTTPVANFRGYTTGSDGARTAILRFTSSDDANWALARYDAYQHIWHTNGSERARIDASGNLGIGTTSPAMPVHIYKNSNTNTYYRAVNSVASVDIGVAGDGLGILWNNSNYSLAFGTNNTERARIDSSGNLLVGTNSGSTNTVYRTDNSNPILIARNGAASGTIYGVTVNYSGQAPNNTTSFFLQCNDTGAERATIRSNGGLANYSANNVNLSDARTKTDIQDAGNYLAKICAIPVRTFKYKDQTDDFLNLGCIAQEVEAVAPELVDVSGFGETPEDGVPLKAIFQTDLQYALMKCIQEQQAIITQLQADVAALKG